MRWFFSLLVALSFLGCSEDVVVVVVEGHVRKSAREGSEDIRSYELGRTLSARHIAVWDPRDGFPVDGGYMLFRDVAPLPLATIKRFVVAPRLPRTPDGTSNDHVYDAGDGVEIWTGTAQLAGRSLVVEDGVPKGFVSTLDLGIAPPTATQMFALAEDSLRRLDVVGATEAANATLHLEASHAAAAEMLAELVQKADPARADTLRALRTPAAPWPVLAAAPVNVGDEVYVVGAPFLRLEPRPDVVFADELPLGAHVRVEEDAGDDVKVVLLDSLKPTPEGDVRERRGYIAKRELSPTLVRADSLMGQADALRAAGDLDRALLVYDRAWAFQARDDIRKKIVDAALAAKRYDKAAQAATREAPPPTKTPSPPSTPVRRRP